jgi:subtilase family serine protease
VADGYYLLESVVDPDGTVVETNERDNATTTLIRLCGSRVEIVGQQGACP